MGRLAAAWKALVYGEGSTSSQSAFGLLPGTQYGSQAPRRGTRELLQAYKRLPYLKSILGRVAGDVASIPWKVYRAPGRGGSAVARSYSGVGGAQRDAIISKAVGKGELQEVSGHEFLAVLSTWNPFLKGHASQKLVQLYMDLAGQAPIVHEHDGLGRPVELWPVPPHWVADVPGPGRPYYRVSQGAWQRQIPEEHMTWGRDVDVEQPFGRGAGFGEALAADLDIMENLNTFVGAFLRHGARPDMLIAVEGAVEHQLRDMKASWMDGHQGPHKAGVPRFLTGKTTVTPVQQTFQQLQMQEQRDSARRILQEVFNIPPEVLGVLDSSNRSTIEAADFHYSKGVLLPRKDAQRALFQDVLARWDERLVLGFENPVPEDVAAQRAHAVSVPTTVRWNEHRKMQGLPPDPAREDDYYEAPTAAPAFGPVGLAAGDPEWVKALPARSPRVAKSAQAMRAALEALRPERLTDAVEPVQAELFGFFGQAALAEVGVSTAFDMRNPLVLQRLEDAGKRIVGCTETTRQAIRDELQEGVAAGEGIEALRRRIEDVFAAADSSRARTIARTEVVGTSNAANLEGWRQSDVVDGKEWVAGDMSSSPEDERAHEKMNGQRVGLDEHFRSPLGHKALHPGGFGRADEDINCMCTAVAVVNDPEKAMRREARKTWQEDVQRWEEKMETAVKRGFQRQREDVLRAIGRV